MAHGGREHPFVGIGLLSLDTRSNCCSGGRACCRATRHPAPPDRPGPPRRRRDSTRACACGWYQHGVGQAIDRPDRRQSSAAGGLVRPIAASADAGRWRCRRRSWRGHPRRASRSPASPRTRPPSSRRGTPRNGGDRPRGQHRQASPRRRSGRPAQCSFGRPHRHRAGAPAPPPPAGPCQTAPSRVPPAGEIEPGNRQIATRPELDEGTAGQRGRTGGSLAAITAPWPGRYPAAPRSSSMLRPDGAAAPAPRPPQHRRSGRRRPRRWRCCRRWWRGCGSAPTRSAPPPEPAPAATVSTAMRSNAATVVARADAQPARPRMTPDKARDPARQVESEFRPRRGPAGNQQVRAARDRAQRPRRRPAAGQVGEYRRGRATASPAHRVRPPPAGWPAERDGAHDGLDIPGAAADVAGERMADVGLVGAAGCSATGPRPPSPCPACSSRTARRRPRRRPAAATDSVPYSRPQALDRGDRAGLRPERPASGRTCTGLPSSSTVQAPHSPSPQPTLRPVSPSPSRRMSLSRSAGSASTSVCRPFTLRLIRIPDPSS